MWEHYISIDAQGRIIDGYTTAQREPSEGDVYLHDGGAVFELFGRDPYRDLCVVIEGQPVWLYAYDESRVRYRTAEELAADTPAVAPRPSAFQRLEDAEADIETLAMAMAIAFGGDV